MIDTSFVSYSDAIGGKDPDTYSPTLRDYHCLLWSKQLPCGKSFDLVADAAPPFYLHHSSKLGTFRLSSDCIVHTYSRRKSMLPIIEQFAEGEIRAFWDLGSTVGARAVILPAWWMCLGCWTHSADKILSAVQ